MNKTQVIVFEQWTLDPCTNRLYSEDLSFETLEARHVLLLAFLAENTAEIVTREQLIEAVWHNRYIEYKTINANISRLRKILGGDINAFIKTHPKLGYSLACPVRFDDRSRWLEKVSATDNANKPAAKEAIAEVATIKKKVNAGYYGLFAFLLLILLVIFWLIWYSPVTPVEDKTIKNVEIQPLTYMKGWEFFPALSSDRSLLAFTHKAIEDPYHTYQVVVQDLATKQTISLPEEALSPVWSSQGQDLFYMAIGNNSCVVNKVSVLATFTFSAAEPIVTCGAGDDLSRIAVSSDKNWLYYSFKASESSAIKIKRYHLRNHYSETLAAPKGKHEEHIQFSLSPDNSYLAFVRHDDNDAMDIMLLNLVNGELSALAKPLRIVDSLAWNKASSHVFYTDKIEKSLKAINIHSKEVLSVYSFTDTADYPQVISEDEVLLTFGELYSVDVKSIDLSDSKSPLSTLITSSFKDHSATTFSGEAGKRIAFVSSRTGNNQIWYKENNVLHQLTDFEGMPYLTELSLSGNGEKLLFDKNGKLHVLDIDTKKVTVLSDSNGHVKNFIWQCHSDENVLLNIFEKEVWRLYQFNMQTQQSIRLAEDIISIHSYCGESKADSRYYASSITGGGVYPLTDNWQFDESELFFPGVKFWENRQWGVTDTALYRITFKKELYKLDLATKQETTIDLGNINAYYLSVEGDSILLNDLQFADTYIGKVTIPNLSEILAQH